MSDGIIRVLGIDLNRKVRLSDDELTGCRKVVLTDRFRWLLPPVTVESTRRECIPISPLTEAVAAIREGLAQGDVAVLASGDPLFFGIARMLIKEFGRQNVEIVPAVSSLQHAFARFRLPWDEAALVSLHGRRPRNLIGPLLAHPLTAVLTDQVNRPEVIARKLHEFTADSESDITIHVAENLGLEDERCVSGSAGEIAAARFGGLCCMVVVLSQTTTSVVPYNFGLCEEEISHSRGLITKSEVRAAALHALAIPADGVFWDVGAGSGSVGLEAARMCRDVVVYAVEKQQEQWRNIKENMRRYGIANLKLITGSAPEALTGLPRPDRIFVGGSGGNLALIIEHGAMALLPGGRMVVSAVLEKTADEAPRHLHRHGLQVELRRIAVERMGYPENETTRFNPITLVVGKKAVAEDGKCR